jgi:rSAM/selenodomain-associated transferase 1
VRVVVMAKAPAAGQVKTRLAAAVGPARAAAFAGAFLDDTLSLAARCAPVVLATTRRRVRPGVETWLQGEGDLGERLARVMGRAAPAVVVGGDSPGLPEAWLRAALAAVAAGRSALVPAEDGGFALLGLPWCPAGLFDGIPWSTPEAGEAMLRALHRHDLPPVVPGTWWDVDEPADLARLARDVPPAQIPATARLLRSV